MSDSDDSGGKVHPIRTQYLQKGGAIDVIVGRRLVRSRKALHTNAAELAAIVGVTSDQYTKIEAGLLRCPTNLLARIAAEANVTVAWFFREAADDWVPPSDAPD